MKAKVIKSGEIKTLSISSFSFDPYIETEYTDGNGNYYKESELERIPEPAPEKAVIEGWVARDKDTSHGCDLHLFTKVKPERREPMSDWVGGLSRIVLDSSLFPSVTWKSEPRKARIEITLIDEEIKKEI